MSLLPHYQVPEILRWRPLVSFSHSVFRLLPSVFFHPS